MQIAIPFSYTAEEIPPKCRKPRKVQKDASLTVSIAEITGAQAPVAFLEHGSDFGESFTREYRWYSDCLWLLEKVNSRNDDSEIQTAEQFLKNPECLHSVAQHYDSRQDNKTAIFKRASEIVFIDGVRWRRTLEPEYCILASINWTSLDVVYGAKHEIGARWYYRIDQLEDALGQIRLGYGKGVRDYSRFEVLIPKALRLPATPKVEKFEVSVMLAVEGRGVQSAAREFVSSLGIDRFHASGVSFKVYNLQTGETATVELPYEGKMRGSSNRPQ